MGWWWWVLYLNNWWVESDGGVGKSTPTTIGWFWRIVREWYHYTPYIVTIINKCPTGGRDKFCSGRKGTWHSREDTRRNGVELFGKQEFISDSTRGGLEVLKIICPPADWRKIVG